MTRLLVSVRDDQEACTALAGGADLIDIKEPLNGPLGAASPETWRAVRTAMTEWTAASHGVPAAGVLEAGVLAARSATREPCLVRGRTTESIGYLRSVVPLSVALGELLPRNDRTRATELEGFAYAKIGLAGCQAIDDWADHWNRWIDKLPDRCSPVAVAYADYLAVDAPHPSLILAVAKLTRARTLLIDTYHKSSGDLWQWMADGELREVIRLARDAGFQVALAGSLHLATLPRALQLTPDWIAVRGAVCEEGRDSRVARWRVEQFAAILSTPRQKK